MQNTNPFHDGGAASASTSDTFMSQKPVPSLSKYFSKESSESSVFDQLGISASDTAPRDSYQETSDQSVKSESRPVAMASNSPIILPKSFQAQSVASATSENKLQQYFGAEHEVQHTITPPNSLLPATQAVQSPLDPEATMMNPVYLSPTEGFGFTGAIPSPDTFLTPSTEQDVFTACLLSSDADRRHDAWIPSETTRKALKAMESNPPGIYFPEKALLTMPGIAVTEDFGDPIKRLLRTHVGEEVASKRDVLTASSVTQDDRGLRQLIAAGCLHAAVNLTTRLLTVYGQGEGRAGKPSKHTAHSIQLWFTRLALLVKLRRYSLAEVEAEQFGMLDAPDLYFEFYPELYGGRKGSMVPFSFRLLVAELPHYLNRHTTALDRLNSLLHTCQKIVSNLRSGLSESGECVELTSTMRDDSIKFWSNRTDRVMYSLIAVAASLKDYRLCGSLLRTLLDSHKHSSDEAGLYSALGRLQLHIGDIAAAQACFNKYLEVAPRPNPEQGLLHSAYIAMANNDFKQAVDILQQARDVAPSNPLVINNLGVCLVYLGRVRDAVSIVQSAVYAEPTTMLHESLVVNLSTMYELESSNALANKVKLLQLVAQHKGDSFSTSAFKFALN